MQKLWVAVLFFSLSVLNAQASEMPSQIKLKDRTIIGTDQVAEFKSPSISAPKKSRQESLFGYLSEDIPAVLSEKDVELYKKMFRLQRQRQRSQVARMVSQLESGVLMGHLIAVRLLHPKTRSPYSDLRKWLAKYSDHAQSPEVYRLANSRRPKGDRIGHKKPDVLKASLARYSDPDERPKERTGNSYKRKSLLKKLKTYRQRQYYTKAMKILEKDETRKLLGNETWSQVSLKLARHMMSDRYYKKALNLSEVVVAKSESRQPQALWMAGFISYAQGDMDGAVSHFRRLAYSVPKNSRYFAQGAWWASKAYEESGRESIARVFTNLAAEDPYSFYGQMAVEKLGRKKVTNWKMPRMDDRHKQILFSDPVIQRVIALVQIGEHGIAQQELKQLNARLPYDMDESLLALSVQLQLPHTSLTLARNLHEQGQTFLAGLYPDTGMWAPRNGLKVDSALLQAIMRQESAFNPYVVSRAGARGLMQLMPATARFMRQKSNQPVFSKSALNNPEINMMLGQEYLRFLDKQLEGNLVHIVAGYNAGPGSVRKWLASGLGNDLGKEDPMLFIESIPFPETREYVKHVLSNLWMYRSRSGEDAPTLTAMANNRWPIQLAGLLDMRESASN